MPQISVVVPVYKVEDKICRCVDSILAQTFSNFELILVDDGSPDRSGEICDGYEKKDSRVRVIHKENKGVSAARNTGINEAKGKYLTFVDSDDYVELQYLEKLFEGIQQNNQLSVCGVIYVQNETQQKSKQKVYRDFECDLKPENSSSLIAELLDDRRLNYVYAKMYNTELIKSNGISFDESVSLGEDTVFVMDYLSVIRKIQIVGEAYYYYIKYGAESLTGRVYKHHYENYIRINKHIEQTFAEMGWLNEATLKAIDKRWVLSAIWTADAVVSDKKTTKAEKAKELEIIFNEQRLFKALENTKDIFDSEELTKVLLKGSAKKVIGFYRQKEIGHKVKAFAVTVIPKPIRKGIKKCLRIAQ